LRKGGTTKYSPFLDGETSRSEKASLVPSETGAQSIWGLSHFRIDEELDHTFIAPIEAHDSLVTEP
jgi:hypothetical protein